MIDDRALSDKHETQITNVSAFEDRMNIRELIANIQERDQPNISQATPHPYDENSIVWFSWFSSTRAKSPGIHAFMWSISRPNWRLFVPYSKRERERERESWASAAQYLKK